MNDQFLARFTGFTMVVYFLAIVLSGMDQMAAYEAPNATDTEINVVSEKATDGIYAHFASIKTCTQPVAQTPVRSFYWRLVVLVNVLTDNELVLEEFRSNRVLLQFPDTEIALLFHSFW